MEQDSNMEQEEKKEYYEMEPEEDMFKEIREITKKYEGIRIDYRAVQGYFKKLRENSVDNESFK